METTGVRSGVGEDGPPRRTIDVLLAIATRSRLWTLLVLAFMASTTVSLPMIAWCLLRVVGHLRNIQALLGD